MDPYSAPKEVLEEALRKAYANSLYHTCKELCGFKDMTERTHGPIIRAIESDSKRKMICVPRGTLKSSIGSVGTPIWLLENNPNLRILIDSEIYTNSVTYLREIKGIIKTSKFMDLFGDWESDIWNESEIVIKPRSIVKKEASITVGAIGTTKVGQHYDYIIGDDYNSTRNSLTHEQRQKVIQHFRYNLSILDPGGTYLLIGTRYAEEDLIGWIISNVLGLKRLEDLKAQPKVNGVYTL